MLTFAAGTHLVNADIPAGRYVAEKAVSGCYWERLSGLSGSLDDILSNDFQGFTGRAIVDVLPTDTAFKFTGSCGTFKTYTAPVAPSATISPGAHVVGANIVPGTYIATVQSGCYWERDNSFTGNTGAVLSNDFIADPGTAIVTISTTDVGFRTNAECGTWNPS